MLNARSRDFCHPGMVGKKEGEKWAEVIWRQCDSGWIEWGQVEEAICDSIM